MFARTRNEPESGAKATRGTAMQKKTGMKKREVTTTAAKRKLSFAKRRTRTLGKERGARNYVLEPHPALYL